MRIKSFFQCRMRQILPFFVMELNQKVQTALEEQFDANHFTTDLNKYIDSFLPAVVKFIGDNEMDPMALPDIKEGFYVKPLIIPYHGQLELTNGLFKNLQTLRRSGDVTVSYTDKVVKVSTNFGLENLMFDYHYLAKIMGLGLSGGVIGIIKTCSIHCKFRVDFNNENVQLQDFYLYSVGNLSIIFTGNVLVDWLTNVLVKLITLLFKSVIMKYVEKSMKESLEENIDIINCSISQSRALMTQITAAHKQILSAITAT